MTGGYIHIVRIDPYSVIYIHMLIRQIHTILITLVPNYALQKAALDHTGLERIT